MPKVKVIWIIGEERLPNFSERSSERIKPLVQIPGETIDEPDETVVLSDINDKWWDIILYYIGLK